jgi:non-specific serine/threonine protein kinase
VLDASAQLADTLLQACPRVQILATSREPFAIPGEAVFGVPSLAFPDPEHLPAPERLADFVAVRLFVDRARLVQPDFAVSRANAAALAHICQRLDGIPLALELAAARLRLLTTEALSERLDDVFHLLTAGSRVALPRQQTLRATIDWSYQLLSEPERRLLQRLSVFAGGWTLEAAEAVGADVSAAQDRKPPRQPAGAPALGVSPGLPASSVLELLGSLVDKSMVVADRQAVEPRYRLLEMVREFALEKLQAGGEGDGLSDRHADYFLQSAERDAPKIYLKQRPRWVRKFMADHENFRRALEWLLDDPARVERGLRLIVGLWPYWDTGNHLEPLHWIERGLALLQAGAVVPPSIHALMLAVGAVYVGYNNPHAAQLLAEQAIAISRGQGPEANETLVRCLLASMPYYQAKPEYWDQDEARLSEAEMLVSSLGSQSSREPGFYRAEIDLRRGFLEMFRGRYERARAHLLQSAARFDAGCHELFLIGPYQGLGDIALRQGDNDQAYAHYAEALRLANNQGSSGPGFLLAALCETEFRRGNLRAALEHSRVYLRVAYEAPTPINVLERLEAMAKIFAKAGRPREAARLSGAAEFWSEKHGRKISAVSSSNTRPGDYLLRFSDVDLAALVPDWQTRPDADSIRRSWDEGRAMGYDQAVAYALSLSLDDTSAGS